jgi:hypothetical protein
MLNTIQGMQADFAALRRVLNGIAVVEERFPRIKACEAPCKEASAETIWREKLPDMRFAAYKLTRKLGFSKALAATLCGYLKGPGLPTDLRPSLTGGKR